MNVLGEHSRVFVAWTGISRRSEQIAGKLNMSYFRFDRSSGNAIKRSGKLLTNSLRTLLLFFRIRPKTVFTYHVHPLISCIGMIYKSISGCRLVCDLHTGAYVDYHVFPLNILNYYVWQRADRILLHNRESGKYLRSKHRLLAQKIFVLEDPIPVFPEHHDTLSRKWDVDGTSGVLVSRFRPDEPIEAFLEAAGNFPSVKFFLTGRYEAARFPIHELVPQNVYLTGFIPDNEYIALLRSVNFIIVLTDWEMTLVSGGYETLAVKKPLIVSDTRTLRDYFSKHAVYTDNKPDGISQAISKLIANLDHYESLTKKLSRQKKEEWEAKKSLLLVELGLDN